MPRAVEDHHRSARSAPCSGAIAGTRLGELASSSPSRMTWTLTDGSSLRPQRVERGQEADDRRLVVGRRRSRRSARPRLRRARPARTDPPAATSSGRPAGRRSGSRRAPSVGPRNSSARRRADCLSSRASPRGEPVSRRHRLQMIRVTADVRLVGRDVGDRQRCQQFVDNRLLVRSDPAETAGLNRRPGSAPP